MTVDNPAIKSVDQYIEFNDQERLTHRLQHFSKKYQPKEGRLRDEFFAEVSMLLTEIQRSAAKPFIDCAVQRAQLNPQPPMFFKEEGTPA